MNPCFWFISALEKHFWQSSICLKSQLWNCSLPVNWVTWHSVSFPLPKYVQISCLEVVMVPGEQRSNPGVEWVCESADKMTWREFWRKGPQQCGIYAGNNKTSINQFGGNVETGFLWRQCERQRQKSWFDGSDAAAWRLLKDVSGSKTKPPSRDSNRFHLFTCLPLHVKSILSVPTRGFK